MSRGLGSTQRATLDNLEARPLVDDPAGGTGWRRGLRSAAIAEAVGRSTAQVRAACTSPERRGLGTITRGHNKPGRRRVVWLPEALALMEASWARFACKGGGTLTRLALIVR